MKQRLGLAYTLLGDPELLVLDEPTNGMDPAGMAEVRELIRGLGGENRTVILSSHLLNEVEQVCDSVAILSHGRLIAQGDVAELLQERGQPQVRLRTTDDRKAWEILNALAWVDSVSADNGYLVAGSVPGPLLGDNRRPQPQRGVCIGDDSGSDVAGAVLPRRNGRGGYLMAMAMQVALLTRWEWFKLRRRWVPWILLGFVLIDSAAPILAGRYPFRRRVISVARREYRQRPGVLRLLRSFHRGDSGRRGAGRRIRLGNAAPGAEQGRRTLALPERPKSRWWYWSPPPF